MATGFEAVAWAVQAARGQTYLFLSTLNSATPGRSSGTTAKMSPSKLRRSYHLCNSRQAGGEWQGSCGTGARGRHGTPAERRPYKIRRVTYRKERLARAQLADSLCALAFTQSARVGGLKIKPAKVLLTSPECDRHSWLSCFGWGRCGASLRAERCAPAIDFAHS